MKSLREKEKEKRHFTDFYSSSPRYKDHCYKKNKEPKMGSSRADLT